MTRPDNLGMKNFLVRIELIDTDHDSEEYKVLHQAMAEVGFDKELRHGSVVYILPSGEYINRTLNSMIEAEIRVKTAASKTGKKFRMLLTEAGTIVPYNLKNPLHKG
jgi:hypothetical protein